MQVYYRNCPKELVSTLVELYIYYNNNKINDIKKGNINKEVYNVIFATLSEQINQEIENIEKEKDDINNDVANAMKKISEEIEPADPKAPKLPEAGDPSQFEIRIYKIAASYMKNPSFGQQMLSRIMFLDTQREERLRGQAIKFRALAIFCCLLKADEPLATLITRTFETDTSWFHPHSSAKGICKQYQESSSKGLQTFGFISEYRRKQQEEAQKTTQELARERGLRECETRERKEKDVEETRKRDDTEKRAQEATRERKEETRKREAAERIAQEATREREEETRKREAAEKLAQEAILKNEALEKKFSQFQAKGTPEEPPANSSNSCTVM